MKNTLKGLVVGILIGTIITGGAAFARTGTELIEAAYKNIKIYIDGTKIDPTDATGKSVEPFIYNGTTYLPVRAVAESLGLNVSWDGATNTVQLYNGDTPPHINKTEEDVELFCKKIEGIWVDEKASRPFGENDAIFDFCAFSNQEIYSATYPGGGDRTGKIIGVTNLGDNEYMLKIYYPEEWFMGDFYEESTIDSRIELTDNTIKFPDANDVEWSFMGKTLEEAKSNVTRYQSGLSEEELIKIVRKNLNVPDHSGITYIIYEKYFWEGAGLYCQRIEFYKNGELLACADVDPRNGDLMRGIYSAQ